MSGRTQPNRLHQQVAPGAGALAESLNLQDAPILQTSATCKSGLAFIETTCSEDTPLIMQPFYDDAFLISLQLQAWGFDLYADGRLIRPQGIVAGATLIADFRYSPAYERREPFHAVDLYIPHKSLNALTEDANAPAIDELRHVPGNALQDHVTGHLLLAMRPALSGQSPTSELFVDYVARALATHVALTYGGMGVRLEAKSAKLARWQEQCAKELIAANLSGNITLTDLAKACGLSIRHFTSAFRGSTGMSPHTWLLQRRVDKAKQQLAFSRRLLAEIALDCGFADQSHMTRVFHRAIGMAPSKWRRLNQRCTVEITSPMLSNSDPSLQDIRPAI